MWGARDGRACDNFSGRSVEPESRRDFSLEWTGGPRAFGLLDQECSPAPGQEAGFRNLSWTPDFGTRARRADVQVEIRPSRRESSRSERPAEAGGNHGTESRFRRRSG